MTKKSEVWSEDREREEWDKFHEMRNDDLQRMAEIDKGLAQKARDQGVYEDWIEYKSRFWLNLSVPIFTSAEAARLSGTTSPQLRNWINRNVVIPYTDVKTGKGNKRKFTTYDVVTFAILGTMSAHGVGLEVFIADKPLFYGISARAYDLAIEKAHRRYPNEGVCILFYRDGGAWKYKPYDADNDRAKFKASLAAYVVIRFDDLIEQTYQKIEELRPGFTKNRKGGNMFDDVFEKT